MAITLGTSHQLEPAPGMSHYQLTHPYVVANSSGTKELPTGPLGVLKEPVVGSLGEDQIVALTLAAMNECQVEFGDLRLGVDYDRMLFTKDTSLSRSGFRSSQGMGLRVVCQGNWGFAATSDLSADGIRAAVRQAVQLAKWVSAAQGDRRGPFHETFVREPAHQGEFHAPGLLCPLSAPAQDVVAPLLEAAQIAAGVNGIKRSDGFVMIHGQRRRIANTEGLSVLKTHVVVDSSLKFIAVKDRAAAYRTLVSPAMAGGYEHLLESDFPGQAQKAAEEAVAKCTAKVPISGDYDLILDPHNLALTMHESVGHPTELDRVLWYEWGMAGGSFASLDKKDNFQYGSPIVNFTANNNLLFGGASVGYDDEGVECQKWPILRDGVLVGYGTNRETAHAIGLERSNGTCRASHWSEAPIVRIPNLYLEPGRDALSLEQLIGDTKKGILLLGRDSFSIDQMRYNFQFGADMAYRVENGKVTEPLRDVIYQSLSPDFWNACDAICDESEWEIHGVFNCGKGQPIQIAKMTHGASPARFRKIRVGY